MGIAVAMPVGPIGVLCISRTLRDGRPAGLATGIGAASADASYGVLVALGLSLSGVLSHAQTLRLGGGMLIMVLGLLGLWRFFAGGADRQVIGARTGLFRTWLTTYLLTLSNPMTILAFIGFIAGLSSGTDTRAAPFVLVVGVFIGSLLWWLVLVQGVHLVKARLGRGLTRWLDLGSGVVLVCWGALIALGAV